MFALFGFPSTLLIIAFRMAISRPWLPKSIFFHSCCTLCSTRSPLGHLACTDAVILFYPPPSFRLRRHPRPFLPPQRWRGGEIQKEKSRTMEVQCPPPPLFSHGNNPLCDHRCERVEGRRGDRRGVIFSLSPKLLDESAPMPLLRLLRSCCGFLNSDCRRNGDTFIRHG